MKIDFHTLSFSMLILILTSSCGHNSTQNKPIFPKNNSKQELKYSIVIDSLEINDSTSSFIGKTFIDDNNIYFADQFLNYVYKFDSAGEFVERYLGSGKSNTELSVGYFCGAAMFTDNTTSVFLGNQTDIHLYNSNYEKINTFQIKNYLNDRDTNIYNTPETYSYALDNFVVRGIGSAVYINTYCEKPGYNSIESPQQYYKNGHPIMKIGTTTAEVEELLWSFPPAYSENYDDKGILFHVLFDIDREGNFYICCEADSTIYAYNKTFNPIGAYGYSGRDMDTTYPVVNNFQDANNVWEQTRNKGLYQWLEYIDATGLLFRTYSKSNDANTWGMQVFSENTMIAEVDVPVGFKVTGYIYPYYYGQIIADPDKKTMKIIRFKLYED